MGGAVQVNARNSEELPPLFAAVGTGSEALVTMILEVADPLEYVLVVQPEWSYWWCSLW